MYGYIFVCMPILIHLTFTYKEHAIEVPVEWIVKHPDTGTYHTRTLYICILVHTHTCSYTLIHTHTYSYILLHIYSCIYSYILMHTRTHSYTLIHTHTYILMHILIHTHAYSYILIHVLIQAMTSNLSLTGKTAFINDPKRDFKLRTEDMHLHSLTYDWLLLLLVQEVKVKCISCSVTHILI